MLYSTLPGLVLGFHGCDESVASQVLEGTSQLRKSENVYDWLGHGIYFWENNPERALQYAKDGMRGKRGSSSKIDKPFVLGAVIDLGHCLNLLDSAALSEVKEAHNLLAKSVEAVGGEMPRNENPPEGKDSLRRNLDCAAFEMLHQIREANESPAYDSVRGVFWEGKELYPGTTMKERNHIQICVRNPNCIKGYFRVREADKSYVLP
ncbi:hypothetical protein [Pelagicoccus mobilis]|uniref:Uncharacterized protein n=1 Tax=Pelagicoccus mobilis TaxID=415221 RepID=A0A934RY29_9BACT|nr:hypothetical protein [Pelagicoccus mobilis]MBK1877590.1 hypothetical protein [Pelagicoccus mobilis]